MDLFINILNLVMEMCNIFFGLTTVLDQRALYYHVSIHTIILTAIMVLQLELNVIVRRYIYRHNMYIAIDSTNCSHGDIKLTGGKSSNEGDVQMCVNGTWGYICGWEWSYSNTNVVCKQLGYTATHCKILKL